MATIQHKVMVKRVKATKIGDVFEVKISDTEKKYMQYIASDLTCLNSDVVRGFLKTYDIADKPSLDEIVSDDVDFYAHCDSRAGIKMEYWTLYGNNQDVGNVRNVTFRGTNEFGDRISENPECIWKSALIGSDLGFTTAAINCGVTYSREGVQKTSCILFQNNYGY